MKEDKLATVSDLLGGLQLAEVFQLSEALSKTTMVPKALQGRKDDILAIILRGRELGLPPMAALNSLQVIEGRTGINSETLLGLVRKSPMCLRLELKESTAKRPPTPTCGAGSRSRGTSPSPLNRRRLLASSGT